MEENSLLLSETFRLKQELNKGLSEAAIENASLAARLSKAEERTGRLESENACLREEADSLTKEVERYNAIELPTKGLEQIEAELALCDKFTANAVADYLTLDTYELVKNLAKTANSSNAAEVIAYRDGAIARNEAVIAVLRKVGKNESEEFKNRITGRLQTKAESVKENKNRTL